MAPLWLVIVFGIATVATVWYLTECALFGRRFEARHHEAWLAAGRPSLWNTSAQRPLLKLIAGSSQLGDAEADLLPQLRRMRVLLVAGFLPMVVVLVYCLVVQV
jgi:hypothetical protein